jgi:hypothetical protein
MPYFCTHCLPTSAQLWRTELSSLQPSSPLPPPRCSTKSLPKLLLLPPHRSLPPRHRLSVQLLHSITAALLAAQLPLVADSRRPITADPTAATIAALPHSLLADPSAGITRSSANKLAAVRPSTVTRKTNSGSGGDSHRLSPTAGRSRHKFSSPPSSSPLPHGRAHQHPLPGRYWCSSQPHPLHFHISTIRTYNSQC